MIKVLAGKKQDMVSLWRCDTVMMSQPCALVCGHVAHADPNFPFVSPQHEHETIFLVFTHCCSRLSSLLLLLLFLPHARTQTRLAPSTQS